MEKRKTTGGLTAPPLTTGQVWRVGEFHLQVGRMGPFTVSYKLAKPDSVRIRTEIDGKNSLEKYLKQHKAVLIQA